MSELWAAACARHEGLNAVFFPIRDKALITAQISANQAGIARHAVAFIDVKTEGVCPVRAPVAVRAGERGIIMNCLNSSARARTVGGIFATIMAAIMLATTAAFDAVAQTPPPAQKPAAAPKKPPPKKPAQKPPAQQPPDGQQQAQTPPIVIPQLIYRRWTKVCPPKEVNPTPGGKQPCFLFMEGREDAGVLVVRATIMEVEGDPKKLLAISFIYGVDLQRGTHIVIDQGPLEATAPYIVCVPPNVPPPLFGCVSQYEINADVVTGLKKGKYLTLQTIFNGQTLSPQLPLVDFAKAYDGPPTDLKAEAEQELKLQEALRKKAKDKEEELTRKQGLAPAKP
jgi:invasion protein IalB